MRCPHCGHCFNHAELSTESAAVAAERAKLPGIYLPRSFLHGTDAGMIRVKRSGSTYTSMSDSDFSGLVSEMSGHQAADREPFVARPPPRVLPEVLQGDVKSTAKSAVNAPPIAPPSLYKNMSINSIQSVRSDSSPLNAPLPTPSPPSAEAAGAHADAWDEDAFSWNEAYQRAIEKQDLLELHRVTYDFAQIAALYGKVILSEMGVPDARRTIKPDKTLGGTAGGVKFRARGILFKLVDDPIVDSSNHSPGQRPKNSFLYGGSEPRIDLAFKAAGGELRGANAYMGAFSTLDAAKNRVRVPLQVMVDHAGFRLICMPLLPIGSGFDQAKNAVDASKDTLVYGGDGAGEMIRVCDGAKAPDVRSRVDAAAKHLHLAKHFTLGKQLQIAGDNEVHIGTDGRAYMLDMARSLPPQDPREVGHLRACDGRPVFFRHFRQEFLQVLRSEGKIGPLSPDALTGFSYNMEDSRSHDARVRKATRFLVNTMVPALARDLDIGNYERIGRAQGGTRAVVQDDVPAILHMRGINLHHMGLLRSKVKSSDWRDRLFVEIISRSVKHLFRRRQRRCLRDSEGRPSAFSLAACVAALLSGVWTGHEDIIDHVRRATRDKYGAVALGSLRGRALASEVKRHRAAIAMRAVRLSGWRFTRAVDESRIQMKENWTLDDLAPHEPRTRGLGVAAFARAIVQYYGFGGHMKSDLWTKEASMRSLVDAAEAHEPHALSWCRGAGIGPYRPPDAKMEFDLLKRLAGARDRQAMFHLGQCYQEGRGVKKDHDEAVRLFRELSEKFQIPWAMEALGKTLLEGNDGQFADRKAAFSWLSKSARKGFVPAQHLVALCFERGNGTDVSARDAILWHERAAKQGHSGSQFALGRIKEADADAVGGNGDRRDVELGLINRALHFYGLARHQNHTRAMEKWKIVELLQKHEKVPTGLALERGALVEMRELRLKGLSIGRVPASLSLLRSLEILDLSGNSLVSLPSTIIRLCDLKTLNVSSNALLALPPLPSGLTRVEAASNRLIDANILPVVSQLPYLTHLDVSNNPLIEFKVGEIPDRKLPFSLESIDIRGCKGVRHIPKAVRSLPKLKTLLCDLAGRGPRRILTPSKSAPPITEHRPALPSGENVSQNSDA